MNLTRTVRWALLLAVVVATLGVGSVSATAPVTGKRVNWPCAGCITYVPSTYNPALPSKVLVALHGDEGDPTYIESVWQPIAQKYNAILIAPKCPTADACPGSWWGWLQGDGNYDDNFIGNQVKTVAASYKLDAAHEYLTGWSGGADYLGWYALSHSAQFHSAGFVVGGVPYFQSCPAGHPSAYFLMGTNDFRYQSGQPSQVASVYKQCGDKVRFVLESGTDHQGTIDTLTSRGYANKIMKWMVAH